MVEPSLKEVVKAMCKAYPGGREAMAGALGMSVTQFNNNLYEKNGCRFFEVNELEAMEDISNTSLLADYFAQRRGALLVDVPQMEDLDRVDLFTRAMRTAAARGQVDQIIQKALEDGVIEPHEADEIHEHHRRHLAAREEEIRAIVALFSRKKSQRSDASGRAGPWRLGVSYSVEKLTHEQFKPIETSEAIQMPSTGGKRFPVRLCGEIKRPAW